MVYDISPDEEISNIDIEGFLTEKINVLTVKSDGNHFKGIFLLSKIHIVLFILDLEFVGWYSTSKNSKIFNNDMKFH